MVPAFRLSRRAVALAATCALLAAAPLAPAPAQHTISLRYTPITNNPTLTVRVNA